MPREPYSPSIQTMSIFVPSSGKLGHIKIGSAIVGVDNGDERITCYYEGGVYQEQSYPEYLSNACGRLAEKYPTVAIVSAPREDLLKVGEVVWDATIGDWVVAEITHIPAVTQWSGWEPVIGGTREQRERGAGIYFSRNQTPETFMAVSTAKAQGRDVVEAILDHAKSKI